MRDIFIVSLACLLAYSVFGEEREIASCDDLKAVIGEGLLTVAGETKLSFVDDTIKCNPGDHPTTVYVGAGHKLVLTDSGKDDEVTLTNVRYTVAGDDARLVVETRIAMKGITWPNGEDGAALSITTGEAVFQKRALFEDMKGSKNGGAVSVKTGGKLTFEDKVTFKRIESEADGGAIFLAESSATFKMDALFIDNKAWDHGGAMFLDDASTTFEGVAVLEGNKAHDDGGAIYLFDSSVATFEKEATFKGNEAQWFGGALASLDSSCTFSSISSFTANKAQISGGAMFLVNASATFKVGSVLEGNEAEFEGGAICLRNDGSITFEGETEFEGNRAQRDGGAMSLRAASVTFSRKVVFEGNEAQDSGGAMFLVGRSSATFKEEAMFKDNEAQVFGGALAMFLDSTCTFGDDISFMDNKAQGVDCTLEGRGGHVYAKDSGTAIVFEEETSAEFSGGKADIGGAIASFDGADVIIEGTAKFAGNVGRKCGDAIATDDTGTFTEAAGSQVSCSDNNTSGSTLPSKCQFGSKMLKSLGTEAPQHLLYKVS
ncbi:unnamed protein product [Discosporangium mesarthrocarpum]